MIVDNYGEGGAKIYSCLGGRTKEKVTIGGKRVGEI